MEYLTLLKRDSEDYWEEYKLWLNDNWQHSNNWENLEQTEEFEEAKDECFYFID